MKRKVYNLEAEHKKMLSKFKKQTENKSKLNTEKARLLINIKNTKDKKTKTSFEKKLKTINKKLEDINVDEERQNYFLNTSKMLYDYYKKDIKKEKDNSEETEESEESEVKELPTGCIQDMIRVVTTSKRSSILDKYMYTLNPGYEMSIMEIGGETVCECGNELTLKRSEGELVCMECGKSNDYVIDSEKKSYKNVPPDITYFAYKRMNHFNELIAQFQAKETTNIPIEIYTKIKGELKKKRFYNLDDLTPDFMREILKKLKLTQYYDHVPHIIHKLNGKPILTLSREQEQKLRGMFKELQEPFVECCPEDRCNFLNYHYTFYKLFEILELDEFLPCFPKLKSKEKLYQQDQIWKCMCKKLGWEFYRTV